MLRPAITQLISKNDSYYSLVIGIAKRAREISDELVAEKQTLEEKPVKTAVEEFANGKFRIVESKKKEETEEETAEAASEENAEETAETAETTDASESAETPAPPVF